MFFAKIIFSLSHFLIVTETVFFCYCLKKAKFPIDILKPGGIL